jgi:LIVCS family branched-chain amino acid:cation transporter
LLYIIASAKIGGSFENMACRVSKSFSLIAGTALIFALGPLLAIPRTAATTYELGVKPLFPFISPLAAIIIYFIINSAFVLKPSSIIDNIGKILTPILLAMLALIIIKGVVTPLGSIVETQAVNVLPADISKTELVIEIARRTLGTFGSVALGLSVALACLTTSIGLTATAAEFFSKTLTKEKLSYSMSVAFITALSIVIAMMGVDNIVKFAAPILSILYPVVIVLILTTLMGRLIKHNKVIAATVYTTLIISVLDTINNLGCLTGALQDVFYLIPLSKRGFTWLVPALLAMFISSWLIKDSEVDEPPLRKTA